MTSVRATVVALLTCGLLVGVLSLAPGRSLADEPSSDPEAAAASEREPEPAERERYDVAYVDERCEEKVAQGIFALEPHAAQLEAGWYVVRANTELKSELVISGDVRLILSNDCTLAAKKGIRVKKDATLTLYGQKNATGRLLVRNGIARMLTSEQRMEEEARLDREPQVLFVWPCWEVVAGTHEPWPSDALEPDPDPDNAPKVVERPKLGDGLLEGGLFSKDYLEFRPLSKHALVEGDHIECTTCGGWFADAAGCERVEESESAGEAAMGAEDAAGVPAIGPEESATAVGSEAATVTITFDANGGSGVMNPIEVTAGEGFVLPECTFTAPDGMKFNSWSLGTPGSTVSVPTNTTIRAWWANAQQGQEQRDANTRQSDAQPSRQQSSSSVQQQDSPNTGDVTTCLRMVATACTVAGSALLLFVRRVAQGNTA